MDNSYIIGIDTGNRCIKTANNIFISGVKMSKTPVPFQQGVLEYDGKYYMLTQERVAYLQDKTESDEYFILSLFAIAKELDYRKADTSQTVPVRLGVGLPPTHLALLKDKFKTYFERGIVTFVYDKRRYCIDIRGVNVFAQAFAAIFDDYAAIKEFKKSYIIDIGGYTTDVLSLKSGHLDPDFFQSLNMGLIQLYNQISWAIFTKYGSAPDEEQIDDMVAEGKEISSKAIYMDIVNEKVTEYLDNMFRKLLEYGIDLNLSKAIFIGGGATRFRKWIEKSPKIDTPYFITNINANAQGYEVFLKAMTQSQQ